MSNHDIDKNQVYVIYVNGCPLFKPSLELTEGQ